MTMVSHNPGEELAFDGLSLKDFTDMIGNIDTFGTKLSDSILNLVKIDSVYDSKYTSWLPVRYNIGASYAINDHHSFAAWSARAMAPSTPDREPSPGGTMYSSTFSSSIGDRTYPFSSF